MKSISLPGWRSNARPGVTLAVAAAEAGDITPVGGPQEPIMVSPKMRRILRPEATGSWIGLLARDYTPDRVETVLRSALAGSHQEQWGLFALMEDTWPRLAKALMELKRAAIQLDWRIEPWAEDGKPPTPSAEERARLVSHALWTMRPRPEEGTNGFEGTVFDLLDAWAKGVTVLEVEWETRRDASGIIAAPRATQWVHPKNYAWSDSGRLGLRLPQNSTRAYATQQRGVLTEFPPDQFLIGICKARSGPALGGALLRSLAWWWSAANFSASWLLNLAQIYGLPIRWAKYAPSASADLINQICDMLENMGSAAWAAFPAGTELELKEAAKAGGTWPQDSLLDRADRQADLLILGQTLTTDVGSSGSRALGNVHKSVRDEIVQAAADWAASVINLQWIPSILRLNYGNADELPEVCPKPKEQADLKADAERIAVLMDRGVPIPRDWLYQTQQIPIPAEGEEVLVKPAAPAVAPGKNETDEADKEPVTARNSQAQQKLADRVLEDLTAVQATWLGGARPWFLKLIRAAKDPKITDAQFITIVEAARASVPQELGPLIKPEAVADALERAMGAAVTNGAISGHVQRSAKLKKQK